MITVTIETVRKWWNTIPIQNLQYPADSWSGYVIKYFPERKDCYQLSDKKILHIWNRELAKKLWLQLGDIPVDKDDNIDEDFYVKETDTLFTKGTDKIEIWHWFEETFDLSVAEDLMGLTK